MYPIMKIVESPYLYYDYKMLPLVDFMSLLIFNSLRGLIVMNVRVLIVDDYLETLLRVKDLCKDDSSIEIIDVVSSIEEIISMIEQEQPNIILLEMNIPKVNGIKLCLCIKEKFPAVHIIIFSGFDFLPYYNQLINNGASGMLNKSASAEELIAMINAVMTGYTLLPLPIYRQMKLHRSHNERRYWEMELTLTERTLLSMIANQYTNAVIAKKIHVSESSVEKYLRKIYEKLGVRKKTEAIERIQNDDRFQPVRPNSSYFSIDDKKPNL